jgi:hypothetical protein
VVIALLLAVPSLYAAVLKHQRDSARATIKEMVARRKAPRGAHEGRNRTSAGITKGVDDEHAKRLDRVR